MKVIIGANISMNGKVLIDEIKEHQVPQQDATNYLINAAIEIGNIVIGRHTFESISSMPGGLQGMFPGVEIVLMSKTFQETSTIKVVDSPEKAITYLSEKGFTEIAVGGGTATYNAFLDKDLVTDIFLNIIPIFTGSDGILGNSPELTTKFALIDHALLLDNCLRLHYTRID